MLLPPCENTRAISCPPLGEGPPQAQACWHPDLRLQPPAPRDKPVLCGSHPAEGALSQQPEPRQAGAYLERLMLRDIARVQGAGLGAQTRSARRSGSRPGESRGVDLRI